jgi:hypothetical protein
LRRSGVTRAAKLRQRVRTPCYGAPKDLSWEHLLFTCQGPCCGTVAVWCPRSCRRRLNRANGQSRFPRNLGDPVVSSALIPAGATGSPTPGLGGALVRRGANRTSERGGTAKRRQRSAAGRAAGSRSALIVPLKQGNSPRRTLGREAERRPADPGAGNRGGTSRLRSLSTERARIASGTLSGMANLSAEEPDALMHARPGPWEPWRGTARATQPEVDWRKCGSCGVGRPDARKETLSGRVYLAVGVGIPLTESQGCKRRRSTSTTVPPTPPTWPAAPVARIGRPVGMEGPPTEACVS